MVAAQQLTPTHLPEHTLEPWLAREARKLGRSQSA
jgi:hypothetical protein